MTKIKVGLNLFEKHWPRTLRGARIGLVVHPASVNTRMEYATGLFLKSRQCRLTAFFGPQHGIYGQTQDNMIEWKGFRDPRTGLPVFSLYGDHRKPSPSMLKGIDALVIDLQDVGSRYYTFIWTMELCMQACAEEGSPMQGCDRFEVGTFLRQGRVVVSIGARAAEGGEAPASLPAWLAQSRFEPVRRRVAEMGARLGSNGHAIEIELAQAGPPKGP